MKQFPIVPLNGTAKREDRHEKVFFNSGLRDGFINALEFIDITAVHHRLDPDFMPGLQQ